jgi:hypothetical protein
VPVLIRAPWHDAPKAGRTKDVSPDGLQLVVDADEGLVPGTELHLSLILSGEVTGGIEVAIRVHGKAMRVERCREDGSDCMRIAAQIETYESMCPTPSGSEYDGNRAGRSRPGRAS